MTPTGDPTARPTAGPATGPSSGPTGPASPAGATAGPSPRPIAVLGAYASLPGRQEEVEEYYRLLAAVPNVRGLELPFRDDLAGPAGLDWLVGRLAPAWDRNIVTAIPGTMVRVWATATFGLASTDRTGRTEALAFTRAVRDGVEALREAAGRDVVAGVELHSAPSGAPGVAHVAEAFGESLAEVADWDWGGALLLVEHCDAYVSDDRGEKRMLTLAEELEVLRELDHPGVRMSLNWGRSALEAHDAGVPLEHVRTARAAGVLEGVAFSGAGPVDTPYAKAWMDGHLPLETDEPGSAMSAARVRECTLAAVGPDSTAPAAGYLGAKCQVPAEADLPTRVAMLTRILQATGVEPWTS